MCSGYGLFIMLVENSKCNQVNLWHRLYTYYPLWKSVTAVKHKIHTLGRKNPIAEATKGEAVKCEQHMKMFHYTQAGLFPGTKIKKWHHMLKKKHSNAD